MINKEAIQRVQSLYSKGVQSDDSRLSNRHIFNKLKTVRARLLTQEDKKGQSISKWAYQNLPCIELEEVPLNECPCEPQSGCTILRSKYPIPSIMMGRDNLMLQSVTGLEGRLRFSETTWQDKKYKAGNKYTFEDPDYFFKDNEGKIYITVTLAIETITIPAIFNDPIEAYKFPNKCNTLDPCISYLDLDFPFEDDLMDGLIELAAIELIDGFSKQREDRNNDSKDEGV